MKTQILRLVCPLSALAACLCSGTASLAQGEPSKSSSDKSGSSILHSLGREAVLKDVLDSPRLRTRISLERKSATVAQALSKLSEHTLVHLTSEGAELSTTSIALRCDAVPLRDILASIAEMGDWEWKWRNESTLVLKERYRPHNLDLYRPRNEAQREVYQRGAEFLSQFGKLSPDTQAALDFNRQVQAGVLQPGVPFTSLPSAVQENLRAMFTANSAATESGGVNLTINSNNLSQSRVSLHVGTSQEGFDPFDVRLLNYLPNGSSGGMSLSFVRFQDPREGYHVVPHDEVGGFQSRSAELDALSRQKALAADPRLKEKVSLRMTGATFFQAITALSAKANLGFASQLPSELGKPGKRTFSFPAMPLGEMLDKLTALYAARDDEGKRYRYTWGKIESPSSQTFVFHVFLEPVQAQE